MSNDHFNHQGFAAGAACLTVGGAAALVGAAIAGLQDAAAVVAEERACWQDSDISRKYADAVGELIRQRSMLRAQASAIARLEVQYHGERMYSRGLERRLAALSRAA
jgi:hypothetical protein